eukprot:2370099-Pleurochrysis_carterae.AAC.1
MACFLKAASARASPCLHLRHGLRLHLRVIDVTRRNGRGLGGARLSFDVLWVWGFHLGRQQARRRLSLPKRRRDRRVGVGAIIVLVVARLRI